MDSSSEITKKMYTTFKEYFKKTERPDLETVKRMKLRGCDDWNDGFQMVCKNGDMEMYKYFVDNGADLAFSGLIGACEGCHIELVELLSVQVEVTQIPFIAACRGGNVDIIKLLYDKNPDVEKYDWDVLCGVCRGGKMDAVTLLLELGFNNYDEGLYGAANGGHLDIVNLMIDRGARSYDQGLCGAAKGGHLEIVKLMIDKGANHSDLVLDTALLNGHLEIIKYLLTLRVGIPPHLLRYACQSGDIELVKFCLELGNYDVNKGLVGAYQGGQLEIVKWMIKLGADVNVFSPWDLTFAGSSEVTRYFLQVCPSLFSDFGRFRITGCLDLYRIYLRHHGEFNEKRYKRLVSCQDPLYYFVINYSQKENKLIRMLPVDVWKLMMPFFV